jgi:hypothetical protein
MMKFCVKFDWDDFKVEEMLIVSVFMVNGFCDIGW